MSETTVPPGTYEVEVWSVEWVGNHFVVVWIIIEGPEAGKKIEFKCNQTEASLLAKRLIATGGR